MRKVGFVILFLALAATLPAQEGFYSPAAIREIRITFPTHAWRHILDSLFQATGDEGKLVGDVIIDGHLCRAAGIRYKGYSSYNADEIKNPFNIDLNHTVPGQSHMGYQKIKLSNVIHDPSFIREVLSYEIARKYMPASGAGYVNLYINDTLIGLYTNVEAVDDRFVSRWWPSGGQAFVKGEPATLVYPFGENANLGFSHGPDSAGYMPYYKMESENGWSRLLDLIQRLDSGAAIAEPVLDIDRTLWMHAFNEVVLNLDSYIGYAQNYYLCLDGHGRFSPVIWDLNMSFGSFRESDGSKNFLGITIPKLKKLDPLALMDFAVSPRPLMTRLFESDTLRKMYLAHMRTILDENIRNGWYLERGTELMDGIDAAVLADTNRFYPYSDFRKNLTVTVGGSGGMKEYPGLQDLMEAHIAWLDGLAGFSGQPVFGPATHTPESPDRGEICTITARVEYASEVMIGFRHATDGIFRKVTMYDDGVHGDSLAGDGVWGAAVTLEGPVLQYYLYAQNDSAGTFSPARAEFEYHTIQATIRPGDVVLNEVLFDTPAHSWIELCNNTSEPLKTAGMRVVSSRNGGSAIDVPDTPIPARGFLLLNDIHALFPGTEDGNRMILLNARGDATDSLSYGVPVSGRSNGRYPNGYGTVTGMMPTPSACNVYGNTPASGVLLYPNPAGDEVRVETMACSGPAEITVFDLAGRTVCHASYPDPGPVNAPRTFTIDLARCSGGIYAVKLTCGNEVSGSSKLIVIK